MALPEHQLEDRFDIDQRLLQRATLRPLGSRQHLFDISGNGRILLRHAVTPTGNKTPAAPSDIQIHHR
jgi:hypothetical protein